MPHRTPWLLDSIDVSRWYYRDPPPIGSTVAYMNESYIDTVARVTPLCIWLTSGRALIRPYPLSRLTTWIVTAHRSPKPRYSRSAANSPTASSPRLRPDMTVLA